MRAGVFLRGENVLARCWGLRTVVGFSHWVESGESRLDISLYSVEVLYKKKTVAAELRMWDSLNFITLGKMNRKDT